MTGLSRRMFLSAAVLSMLCTVPAAFAADLLKFADVYQGAGILGLTFTDKVQQLAGHTIAMRGFMAPPLKAEADFFVLTREPVALCPFCNSDTDWPANIVVVYPAEDQPWVDNTTPIEVTGRLELGSSVDRRTGFASRLRITGAHFNVIG